MWTDLTRSIHPALVTWPGDPSPTITPQARIEAGDSCNTSLLQFPSHLGTHLDAPFHFVQDGKRLHEIDLDKLIGPARVVDCSEARGRISRADLERVNLNGATRVLLRTACSNWLNKSEFRSDFVALDPDAAEYLVEREVGLVGIDYLSIEPFGCEGHRVHHVLLGNEVVVVEGLDLSGLPEGDVEFICLPLKIRDGDGSPCRAVARPL
ncbi:MAG: cyclase family protein [Candidatus Omnitrophica bacterium]|nr:cyclase family protein [Candidatus Omnitrophota bacterium]